ncbi:MAG TPA: phosphoribosylglycinamide formyltransferase [Beijerinckiaceae bacterium]|nr:phosphoribosylglycinamide formyltransferase [Beijerinckiaceae bacterium]
MSRKRIGVLISGRGSNLGALIAAAREPDYPAEIVLVVSNRPDAAGLTRAAEAGLATVVVDHKSFPDRRAFEDELDGTLRAAGVELLCLAGFMRVFTDPFVERWAGRMLNIHPSLLPAFRGTDTHRQALAAGVLIHGCTVHFVTPDLDAGPIVAQAALRVLPGDTEDSLAARVLAEEHRLYPLALRLVCEGGARLDGGRVQHGRTWDGDAAFFSPPIARKL